MKITPAKKKAKLLVSRNAKKNMKYKCWLSPRTRAMIFNKYITPVVRWFGLDVFGTPVKKGDLVYWPIWDSVPKEYQVSNGEPITEVGSRGFFLSSLYDDPDDCDEFYPYTELGKSIFLCEEDVEKWIKKNGHIPPKPLWYECGML